MSSQLGASERTKKIDARCGQVLNCFTIRCPSLHFALCSVMQPGDDIYGNEEVEAAHEDLIYGNTEVEAGNLLYGNADQAPEPTYVVTVPRQGALSPLQFADGKGLSANDSYGDSTAGTSTRLSLLPKVPPSLRTASPNFWTTLLWTKRLRATCRNHMARSDVLPSRGMPVRWRASPRLPGCS